MAYPPMTPLAWLRWPLIERVVRATPADGTVLEIGPGDGTLSARIATLKPYTAVEPDPESARLARPNIEERGGRLVEGFLHDLPPECFDLVCAFEVLEHLEDDRAALHDWLTRVKPGGRLLLSVPAFQRQFNAWDTLAGHYRRYEPEQMRALLTDAGLRDVEVWVYGFPLGNALEKGRDLVARAKRDGRTMRDRTLASGRMPRPPAWMGPAVQLGTLPFRLVPVPQSRGTGLVAVGHGR